MTEQQSRGFITKSAYEQLIQICLKARPFEACGIVVSSEPVTFPSVDQTDEAHAQVIDTIIPIKNIHIDPTHSFAFDPAEWTAAFYDMQKNRQKLVGLFHSHPRTEAIPSSSDTEGFLPASELTYWIVSLQNSEVPHVKPYRLSQGTFIPLQLVLA